MLVRLRAAVPVLLSVTVDAALGVPITVLAKATEVGDALATGAGAPPVAGPESEIRTGVGVRL
jgi:hypothetical protein